MDAAQQSDQQEPASPRDWSPAVSLDELVEDLAQGYRTIGEMVYQVIKKAILGATFAPGERLRQEALATAIGVSRIPVRSALIQLESEGLVVFHPRKGAVVRSLTTDQVREIYELRELLETYALRRSMEHLHAEQIVQLRQQAVELDTQDQGNEFVERRVEFYKRLYDAEHNPQLVELINGLRSTVGRYLLGWRVSDDHGHRGSHQALVEVVARGDIDTAVEALRKHLSLVRAGLEHMLKNQWDTAERRSHPVADKK